MGEIQINADLVTRLVHLLAYQHLQIVHLRGRLAASLAQAVSVEEVERAAKALESEFQQAWVSKDSREEAIVSIALQIGMRLEEKDLESSPDQMWRVFGGDSDQGLREQLGE
jgi:hypothetical protein